MGLAAAVGSVAGTEALVGTSTGRRAITATADVGGLRKVTPLHVAILAHAEREDHVIAASEVVDAILAAAHPRDLTLVLDDAGQSVGMLELAMRLDLLEVHKRLARKYPR